MYVYLQSEPQLWTVGYDSAAMRVNFLNGGCASRPPLIR